MTLGASTLAGRRVKTIGFSPKVTIPNVAIALAGVVLLIVGIAIGNKAVEDLGIGALGAAGISLPIGFGSGVGNVEYDE